MPDSPKCTRGCWFTLKHSNLRYIAGSTVILVVRGSLIEFSYLFLSERSLQACAALPQAVTMARAFSTCKDNSYLPS